MSQKCCFKNIVFPLLIPVLAVLLLFAGCKKSTSKDKNPPSNNHRTTPGDREDPSFTSTKTPTGGFHIAGRKQTKKNRGSRKSTKHHRRDSKGSRKSTKHHRRDSKGSRKSTKHHRRGSKSTRGHAPKNLQGFQLYYGGKYSPVIDGDTIRVVKEGKTYLLRLVGIDTEETYKHGKKTFSNMAQFKKYCQSVRKGSPRPVKFGTPMGEYGKKWAQKWFKGIRKVRLEYANKGRKLGNYGRLLVFVWAKKGGKELNYNLEAVKAGTCPYYYKYGYLGKYHHEFLKAHEDAKAQKLGIWNPNPPLNQYHYLDYPEREKWWSERVRRPVEFKKLKKTNPLFYDLNNPDDFRELTYVTAITALEKKHLAKNIMGISRLEDLKPIAQKLEKASPLLKTFAGQFVLDRMLDMAKKADGRQDLQKFKKTFHRLYTELKAGQFQTTVFGLISEHSRPKIREEGPNEIIPSCTNFHIRQGERVSFSVVFFKKDKSWKYIDMKKLSGYHWCIKGRMSFWRKSGKSKNSKKSRKAKNRKPLWIIQIRLLKKEQIYFP